MSVTSPSTVPLEIQASQGGISDPLTLSTFSEAISSQLPSLVQPTDPNLLVVSPYVDEAHLLDIRTLDTANQLLAKALIGMNCLRKEDYATAPHIEIFNWVEVMDVLRKLANEVDYKWKEQSFYIVVFRSQVLPTTLMADLGALDKAAHAEAMKSGGFLKYWFGTPDANGRNLATCVWRTCLDAKKGSVGPHHIRAATAARHNYSEWRIERLRLTIKEDFEWEIVEWID